MVKKIIACISLLLCCSVTWAQGGKLYNAPNQLSSSFISQVFQDSKGFIWISTRSGLNRYDGYHFTIYKRRNYSAMPSDFVTAVGEASTGQLLVGYTNALQSFDGTAFTSIPLLDEHGKPANTYIKCITRGRDGSTLVGTSGYGVHIIDKDLKPHRMGGAFRGLRFVGKLLQDAKGTYWVIDEKHGLREIHGTASRMWFTAPDVRSSLTSLATDRRGTLYVGSSSQGLFRLVPGAKTFQPVPLPGNPGVSALSLDHQGLLLIGCEGRGVITYNTLTGAVESNPWHDMTTNIDNSRVISIIEDNMGSIWMGMSQKGVYLQPRQQSQFRTLGVHTGGNNIIGNNSIRQAFIDSRGRFWISSEREGIYVLDRDGHQLQHYANIPQAQPIAEANDGSIWVGLNDKGCARIQANLGPLTLVTPSTQLKMNIFDIVIGRDGNIWLATMGNGIFVMTPQGHILRHYHSLLNSDTNRRVNALPNDFVFKLCFTADGSHLFVATAVGLGCLDLKRDSWVSFFGTNCPDYGTHAENVTIDKHDMLWLGTTIGIFCYNLRTRKLQRHYTAADGLPDDGIASLTCDHEGNIWAATYYGLCKISGGRFENFYTSDGLCGNEFSGNAASLSRDGATLLLGGTDGISWFNPRTLRRQSWKADIYLTSFMVNNENRTSRDGEWQLDYSDNSFIVTLSTLTFRDAQDITYLYRLNNDDWTQLPVGNNEITFSHLAPGNYQLAVMAMKNGQRTREKTFSIHVAAPWYRSTVAYIVYLLILVGLFLDYRRRMHEKAQARLALQEHIHAEELGEAKLRAFMNISHEIRTPMTLISAPLDQLIKEDNDPHRHSAYAIMRRNANRILSLINQLLDIRKIDKGQMPMRMQPTNIVQFVGDTVHTFAPVATSKHIHYTFDYDDGDLSVWIDRANFDKVVMNLLSNAFKFTHPGGNVTIKIDHTAEEMRLTVADDGEQIPQDKLDRIFDRFYQVPSSANDTMVGTGIGLDLTRSIVQLHYGQITAENRDRGCAFTVTLPLGKDHLKPSEIVELTANEPTDQEVDIAAEEPTQEEVAAQEDALQADGATTATPDATMIYIAEDDDDIADYLRQQLSDVYTVRTFPNGRLALQGCLQQPPQLLISDIMMPEMDGNTLTTKLKANVRTNDIPVILLTAKNRDEDKLEGLETGADAYIEKPFNMDILRRVIVNLLQSRRTMRNKLNGNESQEERVQQVEMGNVNDKLMQRIMDVINRHLSNSDINVDDIASEVGISRVQFYRKMKVITNQTPHGFIRNLRLQQAARLLRDTDQNITDIMYACGFSSASSFSRMFKDTFGQTPRDYASQHRKG